MKTVARKSKPSSEKQRYYELLGRYVEALAKGQNPDPITCVRECPISFRGKMINATGIWRALREAYLQGKLVDVRENVSEERRGLDADPGRRRRNTLLLKFRRLNLDRFKREIRRLSTSEIDGLKIAYDDFYREVGETPKAINDAIFDEYRRRRTPLPA